MRKTMIWAGTAAGIATAILYLVYSASGTCLAGLITAATFAYHLLFRLVLGFAFDHTMKNRANYNAPWFREKSWERGVYKKLRVKKWKGKFPTFKPEYFDINVRTADEIIQAGCQAEVVHETNVVLSFLPLIVCLAMGDYEDIAVFLITSLLAAAFDMCFVIMQRYNRPRLIRLAKIREVRTGEE